MTQSNDMWAKIIRWHTKELYKVGEHYLRQYGKPARPKAVECRLCRYVQPRDRKQMYDPEFWPYCGQCCDTRQLPIPLTEVNAHNESE